jgi:hypothetical protein
MKATINGIRYDTDKCKKLASYDHRNYANNYSGSTFLLEASNGKLLVYTDSNGQDCHLESFLRSSEEYCANGSIDDFEPIDEDRLVELKLLELCP